MDQPPSYDYADERGDSFVPPFFTTEEPVTTTKLDSAIFMPTGPSYIEDRTLRNRAQEGVQRIENSLKQEHGLEPAFMKESFSLPELSISGVKLQFEYVFLFLIIVMLAILIIKQFMLESTLNHIFMLLTIKSPGT